MASQSLVEDALQTLASTAASLEQDQRDHDQGQHDIPMDLIDPNLQNQSFNPLDSTIYNPSVNLNLLQSDGLPFSTPVQQTRSGRISRPPPAGLDVQNAFFAGFHATPSLSMAVAQALSENQAAAGASSTYDPALVAPYAASETPSTPRANQRDGSTPVQKNGNSNKGKGKRTAPTDDEHGQERRSARPEGTGQDIPGLPEWPLPPKGPRSRKTMSRDEMLNRRRARNRVAAVESRKKKKDMATETETRLAETERNYSDLLMRYQALEQEVKSLRQALALTGAQVPQARSNPAGISYSMFSDDENDEDPEFIPSSPQRQGDEHSQDEDEDDDDDEDEDEDDEDGGSDEDLFLPIQDVPIPSPAPGSAPTTQDVQRLFDAHGIDLAMVRNLIRQGGQ